MASAITIASILTPQSSHFLLEWAAATWGNLMRLFHYRLSLKQRDQQDAFERQDLRGVPFSREAWLRDIFTKQFTFKHRSNSFYFVPEADHRATGIPEHILIGWIARERTVAERTHPQDGLAPTKHDGWRASLLMIDPRKHDDGQKLALESNQDVGQSTPIVTSLIASINDRGATEPFFIQVFPIIMERSFAKFAAEHVGEIQSITYDIAVPNMFESPDSYSDEMRRLRDRANVARAKQTLESDGALNLKETQLDEIASHVEKGGGSITAKTTQGVRYRSNEHAAHTDVDTSDEPEKSPSFWQKIGSKIDEIL